MRNNVQVAASDESMFGTGFARKLVQKKNTHPLCQEEKPPIFGMTVIIKKSHIDDGITKLPHIPNEPFKSPVKPTQFLMSSPLPVATKFGSPPQAQKKGAVIRGAPSNFLRQQKTLYNSPAAEPRNTKPLEQV